MDYDELSFFGDYIDKGSNSESTLKGSGSYAWNGDYAFMQRKTYLYVHSGSLTGIPSSHTTNN